MKRGELRAIIGERRLAAFRAAAAALELTEADLLRRLIDGFLVEDSSTGKPLIAAKQPPTALARAEEVGGRGDYLTSQIPPPPTTQEKEEEACIIQNEDSGRELKERWPGAFPREVVTVFDEWCGVLKWLGETPPVKPSARDVITINQRLAEGFTAERLVDAVQGWTHDDWPERRQPAAHTIAVLLKTRESTEKFALMKKRAFELVELEKEQELAAMSSPLFGIGREDFLAMGRR